MHKLRLRELDVLGVVSGTTIWQHMWYGKSPFQIYKDVDRAFYESIKKESVDVASGREGNLVGNFRGKYNQQRWRSYYTVKIKISNHFEKARFCCQGMIFFTSGKKIN